MKPGLLLKRASAVIGTLADDQDVVAVGTARAAWLAQWTAKDARADGLYPDGLKPFSLAPPTQYGSLHQSCRRMNRACEQASLANVGNTKEWLASKQLLHKRYDAMLSTSGWHEVLWKGENMPLPGYAPPSKLSAC